MSKELIMMKKSLILFFSLIIAAGVLSCGGGSGSQTRQGSIDKDGVVVDKNQSNRGQAKGVATVFDNNTALARDRALGDARNKLVETILGATVSGTSLMENYELVSNVVKSESYGLIKQEKVIEENIMGGNLYYIVIEGTVDKAVVEDAIEKAIERYGRPKMMVLVKEDFLGKENQPGFTQTELVIGEKFGDLGFEFVDPAITKKLMKNQRARMSKAMEGQMGDDVKQLLLGDNIADIVILGQTTTSDQSASVKKFNENMNSHLAVVNLKAVDVYTGVQLAAITRKSAAVHINPNGASIDAIEKVLKQILGQKGSDNKFTPGPFLDSLIKKFTKAATNREIGLLITGLDHSGLTKFRNELQQRIRGVNNVITRGQIGSAAKLDVYFTGKTDEFLDELSAQSDKLGFELKITESFPNRATIQAKLK